MTNTLESTVEPLSASRRQARLLLESLPENLDGHTVVLRIGAVQAVAPSFVDEVVHGILGERSARGLVLEGTDQRFIRFAERAARLRGLAGLSVTG